VSIKLVRQQKGWGAKPVSTLMALNAGPRWLDLIPSSTSSTVHVMKASWSSLALVLKALCNRFLSAWSPRFLAAAFWPIMVDAAVKSQGSRMWVLVPTLSRAASVTVELKEFQAVSTSSRSGPRTANLFWMLMLYWAWRAGSLMKLAAFNCLGVVWDFFDFWRLMHSSAPTTTTTTIIIMVFVVEVSPDSTKGQHYYWLLVNSRG